ncbi:hypothetical protein [Pollutimonas harenae]|uniref:Uncharacterized protein n=1 Tax=Pollutimonas harenae TaxID=657015 RepID=A0A853GSC0_9BURK|nr:hypothetical protein [Pollutimonas harenae]NYT85057.1 hypothetical protein [Pollutimonas harenae]TEA72559.1 hypothetical protein ERD84_01205 [Pollutimonas harenae]
MSDLSYNQYGRLSDSLERDLMRKALSNGESVSIIALAQKALASIKQGIVSTYEYIIDVTEALNEARAKDARFSGSQW